MTASAILPLAIKSFHEANWFSSGTLVAGHPLDTKMVMRNIMCRSEPVLLREHSPAMLTRLSYRYHLGELGMPESVGRVCLKTGIRNGQTVGELRRTLYQHTAPRWPAPTTTMVTGLLAGTVIFTYAFPGMVGTRLCRHAVLVKIVNKRQVFGRQWASGLFECRIRRNPIGSHRDAAQPLKRGTPAQIRPQRYHIHPAKTGKKCQMLRTPASDGRLAPGDCQAGLLSGGAPTAAPISTGNFYSFSMCFRSK